MDILLGSQNFEKDRKTFFKIKILFWLLAAPDGHGKNFSIFLKKDNEFSLTPIYDVMSAYPIIGKSQHQIPSQKLKIAMAVYGKNKNYHWGKIKIRHWVETGKICGFTEKHVKDIIDEIVSCFLGTMEKVEDEIPDGFNNEVASLILQGVKGSFNKLKEGE